MTVPNRNRFSMKLHTQNRVMFFVLFCLLEATLITVEQIKPNFEISMQQWVMLIFAASLIGRSVSILAIGEWIRWPFVKVVPHSSGAGEDTEPKYNDWRRPIGVLLSCPICAGTWGAAVIIILLALYEPLGRYVLYMMSAGGAAMVISRFTELLENTRYVAQEVNGYWNRKNIEEQAPPVGIPVAQRVEHATSKVDISQ